MYFKARVLDLCTVQLLDTVSLYPLNSLRAPHLHFCHLDLFAVWGL